MKKKFFLFWWFCLQSARHSLSLNLNQKCWPISFTPYVRNYPHWLFIKNTRFLKSIEWSMKKKLIKKPFVLKSLIIFYFFPLYWYKMASDFWLLFLPENFILFSGFFFHKYWPSIIFINQKHWSIMSYHHHSFYWIFYFHLFVHMV